MKKKPTSRPRIEDQRHYKKIGKLKKSIADQIHKPSVNIYVDDNHIKHIFNRHKDELEKIGFTPMMFVNAVVSNFNRIYKGHGNALQLVVWNGKANVAIVEINSALEKDFYEVKTAFVRKKRRFEKDVLLWKKSERNSFRAKGPTPF